MTSRVTFHTIGTVDVQLGSNAKVGEEAEEYHGGVQEFKTDRLRMTHKSNHNSSTAVPLEGNFFKGALVLGTASHPGRGNPSVSVVIPAIKSDVADCLPRLLRPIDTQSVPPKETIVVISGVGVDPGDCIEVRRTPYTSQLMSMICAFTVCHHL